MKKCGRCGQEKEVFPKDHEFCEDCCNEMLLGGQSLSTDWSQFDFEKGEWK